MISLVTPSSPRSETQEVIQAVYGLSLPSYVTPPSARRQATRELVDTFVHADSQAPDLALTQAARLLTSALKTHRPPSFGNLNLTEAVNGCLSSRVLSFGPIASAVAGHWGAWGSLTGVITALGGQPLVEQSLLAIGLSRALNPEEVEPFATWFAHPTLLRVLSEITTPIEIFLRRLHDAACFLSDAEVREELCEGEDMFDSDGRGQNAVNLERGELCSRAYSFDLYLELPDLPADARQQVERFYLASGFFSPLEDIIVRAWPAGVSSKSVGLAVNMLGYALAPSVFRCLERQNPEDLADFYREIADRPIDLWANLVGKIAATLETSRARSFESDEPMFSAPPVPPSEGR